MTKFKFWGCAMDNASMRKKLERIEKSSMSFDEKIRKLEITTSIIYDSTNDLKDDVKYISRSVRGIMEEKKENDMFYKNIICWFLCCAAMMIFSFALISLRHDVISIIEKLSSWVTTACIFCYGFYASYKARFFSRTVSYLVSCSSAFIFVCYLGYVLRDFGSIFPEVAAIGFNISTIAQIISVVACVAILSNCVKK